jgi:hypothetical protein
MSCLRHHRGMWVLVVAALLIKLIAGTVCLADAPAQRFASPAGIAASGIALDGMSVDRPVTEVSADDPNTCLLGEAGDCHCTCVHTVTLPSSAPLSIQRVGARFDLSVIHSGFSPANTGSLLRPPIF